MWQHHYHFQVISNTSHPPCLNSRFQSKVFFPPNDRESSNPHRSLSTRRRASALHALFRSRHSPYPCEQPDMSLVGGIEPALPTTRPLTPNLLDLLQNSLILAHIVPHLPPSSLTQLCATNRAFRTVIKTSPGVFRHLDLTQLKAAQVNLDSIDNGGEVWRNVQLDEYLTEEE